MGHSYYQPKRPRYQPPEGMVFTAAEAEAKGRVGSTLSKQARGGALVRLGQGIYSRSDLVPPSWVDALVVAVKSTEVVFSGATALHLRGHLRWAPPAVFLSQGRGAAPPTAPYVPVRVRSVDRDVLQEDTKLSEYGAVWVRTSNPGRAAAELFADRYAIGVAACVSVILELCAEGVLELAEVLKHSRRLHCLTEMKVLLGVACG